MDHFKGKTVHITNELIHNPEVNDKLKNMNVQFIEKMGEGKKNFESVGEGDVVILPAFGASYEEMDYFDKKVRASFARGRSQRYLLFWVGLLTTILGDVVLILECRGGRHNLPLGIQGLEHGG